MRFKLEKHYYQSKYTSAKSGSVPITEYKTHRHYHIVDSLGKYDDEKIFNKLVEYIKKVAEENDWQIIRHETPKRYLLIVKRKGQTLFRCGLTKTKEKCRIHLRIGAIGCEAFERILRKLQ